MKHTEKAELLKDTIYQLHSKEGRTYSYIEKLLGINRNVLSKKIKEWDFPEAEPRRRLTPSNQKFLNKNRNFIKVRLDKDFSIEQIARDLRVTSDYLKRTIIPNDTVLSKAKEDWTTRFNKRVECKNNRLMEESGFDYDFTDEEGEEWREILGYPDYMVSNHGRVKHYAVTYSKFHLIHSWHNKVTNRMYVTLKKKAYQLSRVVAHAFCDGFSEEKNTVNHIDGNPLNNRADNLEWLSQSDNNKHSYEYLGRNKVKVNKIPYIILYKDKYEFKTVTAFAKFIGKSEVQAKRYIAKPTKYNIKLVNK